MPDDGVRVTAGDSAELEARRSEIRAGRLRAAADELARRAVAFQVGADAERHVAAVLGTLVDRGHHLLHDVRWPGTRASNIDHVVVGPSGVYVIDTKRWRGDVDVTAGALSCDGEDRTEEVRQLLAATDAVAAVVAEAGLPALMSHPVILFAGKTLDAAVGGVTVCGERELVTRVLRAGQLLTDEQVEAVWRAVRDGLRPAAAPAPAPAGDAVQLGLITGEELTLAAVEGALQKPIEDWMTFLHPSQAQLVTRSFRGPARIRGATGTGKTSVALHRVARLARLGFTPVLYATFSNKLPGIFRELFLGLAPGAAEHAEFVTIHSWARTLLRTRGMAATVDPVAANDAFEVAWQRAGAGTALDTPRTAAPYWLDEISAVIKGGGLRVFEDYASRQRIGRVVGINQAQRERCWALYEAYEEELARRKIVDFDDLVSMALLAVQVEPLEEPYRCVVVDEVQDCTLEAVRLMAAVTGGGDDALLLVGDGQQSIFRTGFRMADVPLDVGGRVVTLQTNYRTTRQIADLAYRLLGDDAFDDCDDAPSRRGHVDAVRDGPEPVQMTFANDDDQAAALVAAVRERLDDPFTRAGDIGVLVPYRSQVDRLVGALTAQGLHAHGLADRVVPRGIRVGTWASSKGLEFKHVMLPSCREPGEAGSPAETRWSRMLFVAMTRARDTLWMGRVRRGS